MSIQIISRGTKKNGLPTAQIVIKSQDGNGRIISKTKHVVFTGKAGQYLDSRSLIHNI